jgi:glycosyltransferase involved in cell wall biosynthesis
LKVLHVIRSLHKAGAEKLSVDLCRALNMYSDVEVLLVSMNPVNQYEELTKELPVKIINSKVLPSIAGKSIVDIKEFVELVQEFKPDIIHSHLFWSELMSRHVIFSGVKYVTHCHDNMVELNKFSFKTICSKASITKYFERLWIMSKYKKCNNHFIAISKDTQQYLKAVLPNQLKKNIFLLNNAIDFNIYKRPFNFKRNKENSVLRLINVGRFAEYKNQEFLLEVFAILNKEIPNVELHFFGEGECFEKVKNKAEKISNNIFLHGNVNDIPFQLWNSDIYVHAAYYEPYGLVLLEAMAAGLPVIALDGRGNRDIIQNGINGYIIQNENSLLFSEIIKNLWKDKKNYLKMSNSAVRYSMNNDIKEYSNRIREYYYSILHQ